VLYLFFKEFKMFFVVITVFFVVFLSFRFEYTIQTIFPFFSTIYFLSAIFFIMGLSYGIVLRHIGIMFFSFVIAIMLPWFKYWFVVFWPIYEQVSMIGKVFSYFK